MKYIFIVNKLAGGGKYLPLLASIKEAFDSKGKSDSLIFRETAGKGDALEAASEFAAKFGKDCIIVACGGDGTVHECANGLAHTDTSLAVLPFGSGNDFAKKLYGKDANARTAAAELGFTDAKPRFVIKKTDLGKVRFSDGKTEYFNGIMSLGFDVRVEQIADKISRKLPFAAPAAYKLGLGFCLFGEKKTYHIISELNILSDINGVRSFHAVRRKLAYTLIAVCNSSFYGGGYCPAPDAKLGDGLFEVCVAAPCNFAEICNLAPMYRMGVADISPKIKLYTVNSGRFSSPDNTPFTVNLDGENITSSFVDFSVDHKALRLCTSVLSEE